MTEARTNIAPMPDEQIAKLKASIERRWNDKPHYKGGDDPMGSPGCMMRAEEILALIAAAEARRNAFNAMHQRAMRAEKCIRDNWLGDYWRSVDFSEANEVRIILATTEASIEVCPDASEMAALREQLKSVTAEIEQALQIPAESLRGRAVELGVSKLEPLFASVMEQVLAAAGVEDEKAEARAEADGYCTDCESETMLTDGRCACGSGRVITEPAPDYFGQLVGRARQAAEKAIQKYPQPNYVALKIAEEAGEVVRGAVHYAEGRMQWQEVEGEIVQLLAMLFRFVTEGDQVLGALPPEQGAAVKAEVPSDD